MSSWTIDTNKLKQAVAYTHIHMHIWVLYARLETHKSHTSILFFAHSTYYFACLLDCYVVLHKRNAHTHTDDAGKMAFLWFCYWHAVKLVSLHLHIYIELLYYLCMISTFVPTSIVHMYKYMCMCAKIVPSICTPSCSPIHSCQLTEICNVFCRLGHSVSHLHIAFICIYLYINKYVMNTTRVYKNNNTCLRQWNYSDWKKKHVGY